MAEQRWFDPLGRSIVEARLTPARSLAIAFACAAIAILARFALDPVVTGRLPFITFFPALLAASLWGGRLGGGACLAMLVAGGWYFVVPPRFSLGLSLRDAWGLAILLAMGGLLVICAVALREAVVALVRAHDRERLLVQELRHRVKNNLALVQSIAHQTARSSRDVDAYVRALTDRLVALSAATDLLTSSAKEGIELGALAHQVLKPFIDADGARLAIVGETVTIRPEQAVSIAMCLHELATNAIKYGALSATSGQVHIEWAASREGTVRVAWRESGGPEVRTNGSRGFGTALLAHAANGKGLLKLAPEGARWTAEFGADA